MHSTDKKAYPSPFFDEYESRLPPVSRKERRAFNLSGVIRTKDSWEVKMNDPAILARWQEESGFNDEIFNYTLQEVRWCLGRRRVVLDNVQVDDSTVYGVHMSDNLMPDAIRRDVDAAVEALTMQQGYVPDVHPGSDGRVVNFVHPSNYPLVYGVTRVTKAPGSKNVKGWAVSGKPVTVPRNRFHTSRRGDDDDDDDEYECFYRVSTKFGSEHFQWLPAELDVGAEYGVGHFQSYINGVDPANVKLTRVIERIALRFVPLWERVLADLKTPRVPNTDVFKYASEFLPWSDDEDVDDEEVEEEELEEEEGLWKPDIDPRSLLSEYKPPVVEPVSLLNSRLQVIVKIAETTLTPENPEFSGGVWHVEGMENERIVATGIYYWHVENTTESTLLFRQPFGECYFDRMYDSGSTVSQVYGVHAGPTTPDNLGQVVTKAGRCIAFPNIYQHRVAPFRLADPSRPGTRRIIVMFLVDPTVTVRSTATVPPQQPAAAAAALSSLFHNRAMPMDAVRQILGFLGGVYEWDAAMAYRKQLMAERTARTVVAEDGVNYSTQFNLCEH